MLAANSERSDEQQFQIYINDLARAAEVKALAIKDDLLAGYRAKHRDDVASYYFECRRWGDFLSIFVRRAGATAIRKEATSINLALVRQIVIASGNPPDCEYVLTYGYQRSYHNKPTEADSAPPVGLPARYHSPRHPHEVIARYAMVAAEPPIFQLDAPPNEGQSGQITFAHYHGQRRVTHFTTGYARPASDDRLIFAGLNGTLFAPHGRGQEVHKAILAEIAQGWSRPPLMSE